MDVGGASISLKYVNIGLLCQFGNSNSYSQIQVEFQHPWIENLSCIFLSFVSSNRVVINHQKDRDCKCNQALMWVLVMMTTQLGD